MPIETESQLPQAVRDIRRIDTIILQHVSERRPQWEAKLREIYAAFDAQPLTVETLRSEAAGFRSAADGENINLVGLIEAIICVIDARRNEKPIIDCILKLIDIFRNAEKAAEEPTPSPIPDPFPTTGYDAAREESLRPLMESTRKQE